MTEEWTEFGDRKLTAGARRFLTQLRGVLQDSESRRLDPMGALLCELLAEENRATELLDLSGPQLRQLYEQFRQQLNGEQGAFATASTVGERFEFLSWQMTLLRHADRFAIRESVAGATGTEHLLLAALELDPRTCEFFRQAGFHFEDLVQRLELPEQTLEVADLGEIRVAPARSGAVEGPQLMRILDASANRCREGLRVVEDALRFGWDDAGLSRQFKEVRHELAVILRSLGQASWIPTRDTLHDVGTQTSTLSENYRGTAIDVVRANLKRSEEALRTLEEYSKILDEHCSGQFEQLRYRLYTLEKGVETHFNSRQRLQDRRLYLLVTGEQCRYGLETTIRNTVDVGVDIVQLREKGLPDRELLRLAQQVREWTREQDVLFIMNDRPDLAVLAQADGVHLGQDDLPIHAARRIVGSRLLIGVSTHNIVQARRAIYEGADYLGVGPTFPSQTKNFEEFSGLNYVAEVARETSLPWFAIGGITKANLSAVQAAGATRIAVSNTICGAAHPRGVTQELAGALANSRPARPVE